MSDEQQSKEQRPIHIHVNVDGQEIACYVAAKLQPLALVGEQGPEMVVKPGSIHLPEGATVIDHEESEKKGDSTHG